MSHEPSQTAVQSPSVSLPGSGARPNRLRTIAALVLREMSARYGKNVGGYFWAILEPLGFIIILAVAFSLILRSPSLGNNFVLFYAAAMLPFVLYQDISRVTAHSISYSKALLRYPVVHWIDAIAARAVLYTLTSLLIMLIILGGIFLFVETNSPVEFDHLAVACVAAVMLGLGIGLINCLLFGVWPIWRTIWGIVTRPLFLASGVLYIYEDLPPMAQDILWFNPLMHITTVFRQGIYATYEPQFVSLTFVFTVALVCQALGLLLLRRFHLTVLEAK